ncbi:MAG: EAL domain-containing protein [Lachnospiraceae bacterium]|nr:EAL domain-containing protein [Lachnospiraceae bacterium]
MASGKVRHIKELKKNRSWLFVVIYTVISLAAIAAIGFFVYYMTDYMAKSELKAEYDAIKYMASIYETPEDEELLIKSGRDYILTDNGGEVISQNGEDTCSDKGSVLTMPSTGEQVTVYTDEKNGFLQVDRAGKIGVDFKGIFQRFEERGSEDELENLEIFTDTFGLDKTDIRIADFGRKLNINLESVLRLPLWMSAETESGGNVLTAKAYCSVSMLNAVKYLLFCLVITLLALLIFCFALGNILKGFRNQRRTMKVFFEDVVTRGHNWMWFLARGDHMLKTSSAMKETFAVISFSFVKYTNYCLCHSMEEGDRLLKRIHDTISLYLERKELIARSPSPSDFALILKFSDVNALRMRIDTIIHELEKIDGDHIFTFQAGVDVINAAREARERSDRRKLDLEREYNNACAARASLSDKDATGMAFFDSKLMEEQIWEDKVRERQRTALEKEEFVVYYQPKYDPSTDKLKGAEALVRWKSPEFGLVPPGRFIPIFEKNGFITEIDHYMLAHVARDQMKWLREGKECVPVSVNVSRAHFVESGLAEQIKDIVDSEGTPRKLIEIELTESAFFDDKKALVNTISKLREYGFTVSMDDFGSGYSSLNSLKDMPLDVLKLDADFFRGEDNDERGRIVVTETIRLAKSLNMKTVAEGVEDKKQVEFLAKQGCDMIQGFVYDKPMPADEFEQKMQS